MRCGVPTWLCFACFSTSLRYLPWMTGTPFTSIRRTYNTHALDSNLYSMTLTMELASTSGKRWCHWGLGKIFKQLSKLRATGCPRWQDTGWTTQSEGNYLIGMTCLDNLLPSPYRLHQAMTIRLKIQFQMTKIPSWKSLNKMNILVTWSGNRMVRGKQITQRTSSLLYCECSRL